LVLHGGQAPVIEARVSVGSRFRDQIRSPAEEAWTLIPRDAGAGAVARCLPDGGEPATCGGPHEVERPDGDHRAPRSLAERQVQDAQRERVAPPPEVSGMKTSTDRLLTTHVGSIPRPENVRAPPPGPAGWPGDRRGRAGGARGRGCDRSGAATSRGRPRHRLGRRDKQDELPRLYRRAVDGVRAGGGERPECRADQRRRSLGAEGRQPAMANT